MLGYLELKDFDQTYKFNFSKEKLKDKIVEQYSYEDGLLSKNLGRTIIENPEVNKKYKVSTTEWLDKKNWNIYKAEIRQAIADTTNIMIVKHHSRKSIQLRLVITGDEKMSELRIIKVTAERRRAFRKPPNFYQDRLTRKIEHKFIDKLN